MAATGISPLPKFQFSQNGIPVAGGLVFTYESGTTIKQATYTNSQGATPNTNPIVLDANGQCDMWLIQGLYYTIVLSPQGDTDPPSNPYWTEPNITNDAGVLAGNLGASDGVALVNGAAWYASNITSFDATGVPDGASIIFYGRTTENDGGGGVFTYVQSSVQPADGGVVFAPSGGGRLIRNGWTVLGFNGPVNVKWYGSQVDGTTDDTASNQLALASGQTGIYFPPGVSVISAALSLTTSQQMIFGNQNNSIISSNVNNLPIFTVSSGATLFDVEMHSLNLTRSITAVAGGNGITCQGQTERFNFHNLLIENQYVGMSLLSTNYGNVFQCDIRANISDGILMQNTASSGVCQWILDTVLCQLNGGWGFNFQAVSGPSSFQVGSIVNCYTFANTAGGVKLNGVSGVPITGLRFVGGLFSSDGGDEIYVNTYNGSQICIKDVYIQGAGVGPTGPTQTTAPSNVGNGINITANNYLCEISAAHINDCSYNGIVTSAVSTIVSGGGAITDNGVATAGATLQNGILVVASSGGRLIVSGMAVGIGADQLYGVYGDSGVNLSVCDSDLTGNATGAVTAASNLTSITAVGNLPDSLPNTMPGALSVGGAFSAASVKNSGIYSSLSKTVVSTASLTTITLSTTYTYLTGSAGASMAVTLPAGASGIDGELITIMSVNARSSATWVSTGASFVGAPSTIAALTPYTFQYDSASTAWYLTN